MSVVEVQAEVSRFLLKEDFRVDNLKRYEMFPTYISQFPTDKLDIKSA